jgi:hypothetical protein
MWLTSLLLCLAPLASNAAAYYYWVLQQRDAPYQDIKQLPNLTVPELETVCSQMPDCLGFNNGGYLKNNLTALQVSSNPFAHDRIV